MKDVKFGTDGIRDLVNKGLTAEIAFKTGVALALYLVNEKEKPCVLVGYDTRKSCQMLLTALCSGLMSYGVNVLCVGRVTTPAVSYLITNCGVNAGVMITASHNTHEYNGIKVFNEEGEKINLQTTLSIERYAYTMAEFPLAKCEDIGVFTKDKKSLKNYINFLRKKIKKSNLKIVIDCANGVANYTAPQSFKDKVRELIVIGDSTESARVNILNGVMNIKALQTAVVKNGADVGFAFDGDGDRILAVDEKGKVLDGDDILAILAYDLKSKGKLKHNTIVGTIMTNYGIEASLNHYGIKLVRQQVGDRFVYYEMKKNGYDLGGESSGHIVIKNSLNSGDGVLTAIALLNIMTSTKKSLSELVSPWRKYPYELTNIEVNESDKSYILNSIELQDFVAYCEQELGYKGRIVVRASGTENRIRVLVEGEDNRLNKNLADAIKCKILSL